MATTLRENSRKPTKAKKLEGAEKAESLIRPVGDIADYLKILVYGRGGQGKTTFGASSGEKTLILDFNEQGTLSVRKRPNTFVYRIEFWDEIDWIYWYLRAKKHDYKVVVLDTVTSMALIGQKWVLGDEASRDASRDPLMMGKLQWGKLGTLMTTQIYNFRNLPMHVVFLAHERTSETESEDGESIIRETHPALSPAPREALINAVHVAGRIYTRPVTVKDKKTQKTKNIQEHRLLVGADDRYVSKIRKEIDVDIPRVVRKPNLRYFIDNVLPYIPKEENDLAIED